jgi:hypothetical protein
LSPCGLSSLPFPGKSAKLLSMVVNGFGLKDQ